MIHEVPKERDSPPQVPIQDSNPSPPHRIETASTQIPTPSASETVNSDFLQALSALSTLLPDEGRINHLLSPLPAAGGNVLLRELAYRTRIFRDLFQSWENLHLAPHASGNLQLLNPIIGLSPLDRDDYNRLRVFMNAFAQKLFPWTMPYFADHMGLHASFYSGGRGIVFTAGTDQARYLLTSIPAIRRLGCDLPIEVIYLGDDDLNDDARDSLEALPGVVTVDIEEMIDDKGWKLKGWAAKPFAMLYSSFREVIFMDADALFLTNPEDLFHDEQYINTGALFFKDRSMFFENKKAWLRSILPKPISRHVKQNRMWTGESGHMQDSGVVVIDKWKHFVALLLTTRLNGPDRDGDKGTGKKGVYELVYGDKETFWLSWELSGDLGYAFHDGGAGIMGSLGTGEPDEIHDEFAEEDEEDEDEDEEEEWQTIATPTTTSQHKKPVPSAKPRICSPQLLHLDRDGKPMWFNGWLHTSKTKDAGYQSFEVYMREPIRRKGEDSPWELRKSNVVCLSAEEYFEFSAQEQGRLGALLESAKKSSEQ
ncbi:hypothetical protein PRZ48_010358 [Zasmidium cellare]|uniref:Alpha-1,3-mannosyltransferase n=1 Tax=Zasmidium cellare TaxID=395010 RepID=A0ABR0E8E6_ZASCE|nr:hypothetical protein PRZ48_010358 [Zasmidium cellare]